MGAANSTNSLVKVLDNRRILETLCLLCPSLPVRLRRVSKLFSAYFSDEKLSELLPQTFEQLGLYYSNPFLHCHEGDVESAWLMLVHGVDPRITGPVCRCTFSIVSCN